MKKSYDAVVIGGGAVGALALRELTKYGVSAALLEAGADLASGTTRANSAIIHAGYDPAPGTKKALFNVRGAALYPALCRELDIPYMPLPSLVGAYSPEELPVLEELFERGRENGVGGLELIGKKRFSELEPNISKRARGALLAPGSGIVEPWTVAVAAAENACDNGAEVFFCRRVSGLERTNGGFLITALTPEGSEEFFASCVISAAGVHADDVHALLSPPDYKITGKKGQYYVLDKEAAGLVNNILFPCPSEKGKGMLILPEIHGRILMGPDSEISPDKTDVGVTPEGLARIRETVAEYLSVPIPKNLTIRSFAGVRAAADGGDFIIRESPAEKGFFEAAGIESPGLAAAPAIAEKLGKLALSHLGISPERAAAGFSPRRRPRLLTGAAMSKNLPGSAKIVCRCEEISEAEIVDCIRRNCGARTVKGVKLRTGAGAGGCQGGFCQPGVIEILARELGADKSEINYDGPGSEILTGRTKGGQGF